MERVHGWPLEEHRSNSQKGKESMVGHLRQYINAKILLSKRERLHGLPLKAIY
jgi:hypothetical protein